MPPIRPVTTLGTLAILVPVLEAYSPPIAVPVLLAGALALWLQRRHWSFRLPAWLPAWFGALSLYGLASAFWAISPHLALVTGFKTLGLFLCGLVLLSAARSLDGTDRRRFDLMLVTGFILGLLNLEITILTGGFLRGWLERLLLPVIGPQRPFVMPISLDVSMTLTALLVWPAAAAARRRFGWPSAVALYGAACLLVIRQGGSATAAIAILAGAAAFLAALALPRATALLLGGGLVLWMFIAPVALRPAATGSFSAWLERLVPQRVVSLEHRRAIWGFAIGKIEQRPVLGWGLGSSRVIPGGHDKIYRGGEALPLHPHDAALQLWLELGIGGALLGAVFFFFLGRALFRLAPQRAAAAFAVALVFAAVVNGMASFNLWHEWWLSFLLLAGCFLA